MSDPRELFDALTSLVAHRREAMRDNWHRDLPFQELLSDRWKRAEKLGFGEGASIYETSFVYGDVKVGRNTWIGPYTLLDGSGGLTIGDFCSISAGVQIYTHDTVKWAVTGGKAAYERAPVTIGDCCHIGANVVVDIMRTHPTVIVGGILQENPFFVPPDEMLRELRQRAG